MRPAQVAESRTELYFYIMPVSFLHLSQAERCASNETVIISDSVAAMVMERIANTNIIRMHGRFQIKPGEGFQLDNHVFDSAHSFTRTWSW